MKVRSSQQAFEDVQKLASSYPGIVAVFQDIAGWASIQSAVDAAEAKLAGVKSQIAQAQSDLTAMGASHDERVKKQEVAIAARMADVEKDISDRMQAVDAAKAAGAKQAQDAIDAAKNEATRIITTANNAAAALAERNSTAQAAIADLEATIATRQATLDALNQQIEQIEQHKATLAAALQATG